MRGYLSSGTIYKLNQPMYLPPNTIIAAGPVIIENGQVLLNREFETEGNGAEFWMFPGGGVENFDINLEETCHREAREELGITLKIIKPLRTLLVKRPDDASKLAVLVHFLAERIGEIKPGPETLEWGWFPVNQLPPNTAPNVIEIMKEFI